MLSKPLLLLKRLTRRLGVRVLLMSLLALVAAFLARTIDPLIPDELKDRFDRDAVLPILNILASSMLAATTFSLGVMVQAFQAASGQATPRAYRILMQDGTTQTVLATFVSTFLFSLTSIVMFRAEYYTNAAAVVIFGLTVLSIVLIIIAILRWIDHLSQLGSMDHTLRMVEVGARNCLKSAAEAPCLGAQELDPDAEIPTDGIPVRARNSGYVQFVNLPEMHEEIEEAGAEIWVTAPPGRFVLRDAPLGYLIGGSEELAEKASANFTLGRERTLEQDARFGLIMMAEIAARALSPGVNDPGTAIDVIQRLKRLLWEHGNDTSDTPDVKYRCAHVPRIGADDLVDDSFDVIIRDGAGRPEVIGQVLHALGDLENSDWEALVRAAQAKQDYAAEHAEAALSVQSDRDAIASLRD
ncbi:DUF2254 domain-containing protein [Thalassococcus sp. BH17M4-6]|uniref:DUF2254 domain-containing protein n=1 Tax=Thalassococcus sp. BH17M4-6 TaxID=3413148 RepID=UPI003BBA0CED